MARFAELPDVGEDLLALRTEIEAEAQLYASVDWIITFPRVSAADSHRLIRFFGVLSSAYASALALGPPPPGEACPAFDFADAEFRTLRGAGAITQGEYEWYARKVAQAEDDFDLERRSLAQVSGPPGPESGSGPACQAHSSGGSGRRPACTCEADEDLGSVLGVTDNGGRSASAAAIGIQVPGVESG
jgi:hypothetical protein